MAPLFEYLKNPIPTLLNLFNLNRVTPGPVLPMTTTDPANMYRVVPQAKQRGDQFQKPSQTIADSIKRRGQLNRVEKYAIYEEMDRDPLNDEILNAYAEAVTIVNSDKGVVFWVEAENEDIQKMLTSMYAAIGAQERAFAMVRALLKYGDNFLGIQYTPASKGVITLRHYEPWNVARIEDTLNRLIGFAPSDTAGEPMEIEKEAVPPFDVLHQRLLSKDQDSFYGTGLLDTKWEDWEDLQSMEDQIVMQRLLRRPDRLMILMDSTGLSLQEAFEQIKIWETYLYKEINVDTGSKLLDSRGIPMTENRDLIIPKGPNNSTEITNFPASNNNDLLRDWEMKVSKYIGTNGMPKGYFGFEGGDYRSDMSLTKQDPRFAKRAQRTQFAFLHSMTRLGMIHIALTGLNPLRQENTFSVHGMPISNFMEIEYNELLQMRYDLVDRMSRLADDLNLNKDTWVRYVLTNVGKLPKDLIDNLMARETTERVDSVKDAETVHALTESTNLLVAADTVDESMRVCRTHSREQVGLTEETIAQFQDVDSKTTKEGSVFTQSTGESTVRAYQCERAKVRLDRLNAMASSIG